MAAERSRRANAGRNISKLLEQEEASDEFYQTAYGGFHEISEDEEYKSEEEFDDIVDSDFDLSEKDEPISDSEDIAEPKPKRRKWLKEIKPKRPPQTKIPNNKQVAKKSSLSLTCHQEPRTFRKSTIDIKEKTRRSLEEEQQRKKRSHGRTTKAKPGFKMTQEQLLKEAKQTEIENLASLEAYTRLEAERKTSSFKEKKHSINGPVIRYHSVTMPLLNEDGTKRSEKYSRNFLVFTDTQSFPGSYFPTEKPNKPKRLYCKVTGLPAKYVDPLTGHPYSTAHAFRIIRDRFVKEREEKCEQRLLQLSSWLEEKKRLKKQSY